MKELYNDGYRVGITSKGIKAVDKVIESISYVSTNESLEKLNTAILQKGIAIKSGEILECKADTKELQMFLAGYVAGKNKALEKNN